MAGCFSRVSLLGFEDIPCEVEVRMPEGLRKLGAPTPLTTKTTIRVFEDEVLVLELIVSADAAMRIADTIRNNIGELG